MKKSVKVIAGLMIAVLSVSSVSVYAAEKAATREWPAFSKRADAPKGNFGFRFNGRSNGEKPQRKELTEEEKAAKIENIKKALDKRLADGKVTQEQYDEAMAKLESGELRFGGRDFGGSRDKQPGKRGFGRAYGWGNREKPAELTEEEKAARLETMKENRKKALDKRLADGKITQEQYDEAVAKLEAGELRLGGRGFGGSRGLKKGGSRWAEKATAADSAENVQDSAENA